MLYLHNFILNHRSPLLAGTTDQKDVVELDESMVASPPLELRSVPRTIAVPHSLQSPQDRATGK